MGHVFWRSASNYYYLSMAKASYQQKLIRQELDAHIADMVDDLVLNGMDRVEANVLAQREFGDRQEIEAEVILIHKRLAWLPWSPISILSATYALLLAILVVITFAFFSSVEGTAIEVVTVWSIYGGVIGMGALMIFWLSEYFGWHTRAMIFVSAAVTMLMALSLTVIFDIDKFETTIHAAAFSALVMVIANFVWNSISVRFKQLIIYLQSIVILRSIITHDPLFSYIAKPGCWFVTQDSALTGALANCVQVYWWSPILIPVYLTGLISIGYLGYVFAKYVRAQVVSMYRKAGVTLGCIGLIIVPMFVHDINDQAWLDVLSKKPEIYQAYEDILDRQPTTSEMEFYATTRSYQHMNKIREVLFASDERKQKINLVYKEILSRKATDKEIAQHNADKDSIIDIHNQLYSY